MVLVPYVLSNMLTGKKWLSFGFCSHGCARSISCFSKVCESLCMDVHADPVTCLCDTVNDMKTSPLQGVFFSK